MPSYGLTGSITFQSNTNTTPSKTNWISNGSSNPNDCTSDYKWMNSTGGVVIQNSGLYTLTFTCNAAELNYSGSGVISISYVPSNGSAFIISTQSIANIVQHTMPFNAGDILTPIFNLATAYTANCTVPTVLTSFQLVLANATNPYFYYSSTNVPPILNQQPRSLDFIGSLSSGFQVVIPITLDGTTTGTPCFQNITSAIATATSSSKTTSVSNILFTSLDPIPSSLKTITVNVGTGNTIVVGGSPIQAAPANTVIYLTVKGW